MPQLHQTYRGADQRDHGERSGNGTSALTSSFRTTYHGLLGTRRSVQLETFVFFEELAQLVLEIHGQSLPRRVRRLAIALLAWLFTVPHEMPSAAAISASLRFS